MSWVTEDGRHEGYAAHIAKDGREAHATSRDGMHMEVGRYDDPSRMRGWRDGELAPWSELLGWEARCTCGWSGSLWRAQDDEQEAAEHDIGGGLTAEDDVERQWVQHVAVEEAKCGRAPTYV